MGCRFHHVQHPSLLNTEPVLFPGRDVILGNRTEEKPKRKDEGKKKELINKYNFIQLEKTWFFLINQDADAAPPTNQPIKPPFLPNPPPPLPTNEPKNK